MAMGNRKFRSKRQQAAFERSLAGRYQQMVARNPFVWFGLPFCGLVVLGSYWLTAFTQVKFDRDDRKVQELTQEDMLKIKRRGQRKVDVREEYYRLQGLAEEDWDPVRVQRLEDESENVW